jgi:hypothetical protein
MLSLYIRNVKTVNDIGDYEYVVMVNSKQLAAGEIKGHKRSDGWQPLVRRIAGDEDGKG